MMDCFLCTVPGSRDAIFHQVLDRWLRVFHSTDCVRLHVLRPLPGREIDFQAYRRIQAEAWSEDDYILADDDCLLPETSFIDAALHILETHPDFAILSLLPSNATIHPWTPENYSPYRDDDVEEHVSVGGVRFCRKGCLAGSWPMQRGPGYDREQCDRLRALGYRVGYFRNHTMVHLGEGVSSVWPLSKSITVEEAMR